jgi:predicted phage replisome organizer
MNLSFVKVDINILNDSKMKIILREKHGDTYFKMWIGLLCLAMKSGEPGSVEVGDGIPHTAETLSKELNIRQNFIEKGLELFQKYKMIETVSNNILIKNFEKHQELEKIVKGLERNREKVKRYRDKKLEKLKKNEECNGNVTVTTPNVTTETKNKTKNKIQIKNKKVFTGNEKPLPDVLKKNFIQQIVGIFQEEYLSIRTAEYVVLGKDMKAAGQLLKHYKTKNPQSNSERTLLDFRTFFRECLNIKDNWYHDNMTPSMILSKMNEIRQILRNRNGRNTEQFVNSIFSEPTK